VSETLGQSRDDSKSCQFLGSGDENIFRIIVSDINIPELSVEKQDEASDAKTKNKSKDILKCTSLQPEKEEERINSSDKIYNFGSHNTSIINKINKESSKNLAMSLQLETNEIKYNHCNFDDRGCDFEISSKREKGTLNPSIGLEHDDNEDEITDDDDIFYCGHPQNRSSRSASGNKVSGLSVVYEHQRHEITVFNDSSGQSVTKTSHVSSGLGHDNVENNMICDGENPRQENMLNRRRKVIKTSNCSVVSTCAEDENDKTGDGENPRKKNVITNRKIKIATPDHLTEFGCASARNEDEKTDGGENTKRGNILTRGKSRTQTSHQTASGYNENEAVTEKDMIFCDGGGSDNLETECVLPVWERGIKSANHLTESGFDKNEGNITDNDETSNKENVTRRKTGKEMSDNSYGSKHDENEDGITDDGKNAKRENVLTRRKRGRKESNNLVGFKYAEDYITDGETPNKEDVVTRRKTGKEMPNDSYGSKHDENKDGVTDDGKNSEKENVLTRRKRGTKASNSSAGLKHDEDEDGIIDNGETPNKENVVTRKKTGKGMSDDSYGSKHDGNEDGITGDDKNAKKEIVLTRRKRGRKASNSSVGLKHEGGITNDGIHPEKENIFTRKTSGTNASNNSGGLKHDEDGLTDDGKSPNKENVLFRRKRGTKASNNSVGSKHDEDGVTDNGESSIVTEAVFTDSHRQPFSAAVMEKVASNDKSHEDNIHRLEMESKLMKSSRAEMRKVPLTESEHLQNEEETDDDDIFYKTPKRSLFYEKENETIGNICGNENLTSLTSSKTDEHESFRNKSSQSTLTRSNISRESLKCLVKPVVFESENNVDDDFNSNESSLGTEDVFTHSYRQQFTAGVMKKIASCDISDDNIHRLKIKSKLMKNSRTEIRKVPLSGSEHLEKEEEVEEEDEDDDDDDIFYKTPKHSLFYAKEKGSNICGSENLTSLTSSKTNMHKSFKNISSQSTVNRNTVSRESLKYVRKPVIFESSDESSSGIESVFMDSYRQQFSASVMEKIHDGIHRQEMESKVMKRNRAETQKDHLATSKQLEDDDDDDDIFFVKTLSNYHIKKKQVGNIIVTENFTFLKSKF
jgi:hypothetical protein